MGCSASDRESAPVQEELPVNSGAAVIDYFRGGLPEYTASIRPGTAPSITTALTKAEAEMVKEMTALYPEKDAVESAIYEVFAYTSNPDRSHPIAYAVWVYGRDGEARTGRIREFDLSGHETGRSEDSWWDDQPGGRPDR